jgi:hypothetical protein
MLRSAHLLRGYEDLGMVIDPDAAQQTWYSHGAWDATLFEHGGSYCILFGGRSSAEKGSFRHYGLAVGRGVEGPYSVLPEPFFINPHGDVGGRSAVFQNEDNTITAIVDLWLPQEGRTAVRGLRLDLNRLAAMAPVGSSS